jgi:hypothetical protein
MKQGNTMSKMKMLAIALAVLGGLVTSVNAGMTTFTPKDIDLADLPHQYCYKWGISYTLAPGEVITGATLTFTNIWDWTDESNDALYVHLLDNPSAGVKAIYDNQDGDKFANMGTLVGVWNDPLGGNARNFNLEYDFAALGLLDELNTYANTASTGKRIANFGFGIDPDCHYFNDGVKFTIITSSPAPAPIVPTPAAVSLGGMGIMMVGWLRMRKTLK